MNVNLLLPLLCLLFLLLRVFFCASCPHFSYCFSCFVWFWNTHSLCKTFSMQLKGCIPAQAGARGWTLLGWVMAASPDFAVNEIPLLLCALCRGRAESSKGTCAFLIRPANELVQALKAGFPAAMLFMFLCSKLSLKTSFLNTFTHSELFFQTQW